MSGIIKAGLTQCKSC